MLLQGLALISSLSLTTSTLLINYAAPAPISEFGSCQFEGSYKGDRIPCPGNDNVYIKPGSDPRAKLLYITTATPASGEQRKNGADDASDNQDLVFNLGWTKTLPTRLSLGYTPPGTARDGPLWTVSSNFALNTTHNIALAWDTKSGGNNNLQVWLDAKSILNKGGLSLWTGETYPKFGLYEGEAGDHDTPGESNIFDLYVYKVQLSDASLDEVSGASGL